MDDQRQEDLWGVYVLLKRDNHNLKQRIGDLEYTWQHQVANEGDLVALMVSLGIAAVDENGKVSRVVAEHGEVVDPAED